jgi:hypothetical protein
VSANSDNRGRVLKFRLPKPRVESGRHAREDSDGNIVRLLDLSKYERPREAPEAPDEFKRRMRENIAALIVLGVLVGVAATDLSDIEQRQRCTIVWDCGN